MRIVIVLGLAAVLGALTAGFWWIKGQPVDWDGFTRRRGIGTANMHHPGAPLKKQL